MKTVLGTVVALALAGIASAPTSAFGAQSIYGQFAANCPPSAPCKPVPPGLQPIDPLAMPPPGTSYCSHQPVLNPSNGQYEWKQVCG